MKPGPNHRLSARRSCRDITVTICHFNRREQFGATVTNHSEGGLRFRSDRLIKVGAIVVIRYAPCEPHGRAEAWDAGLRHLTIAKVQWCRRCRSPETGYEAGARFLQPSL